jgi:type II secretory ATPase GspE/PulE/Tfp pilus assembly ATPase PilB-like protein
MLPVSKFLKFNIILDPYKCQSHLIGFDFFKKYESTLLVIKHSFYSHDIQNLEQLENSLLAKGIQKEKIESLGLKLETIPDFVYGKGCNNCRGTGYLGRTAVFEFFELNQEIINEILKPVIDETKIREICKKNEMRTLIDNTWDLVIEGVTTVEEIIRVVGE